MALDCLQLMIREHIRNGEPVPRLTKPRGRKDRMIRLPAFQAANIELYWHFTASGIRNAELAKRLGIPKTATPPDRPHTADPRPLRAKNRRILCASPRK